MSICTLLLFLTVRLKVKTRADRWAFSMALSRKDDLRNWKQMPYTGNIVRGYGVAMEGVVNHTVWLTLYTYQ